MNQKKKKRGDFQNKKMEILKFTFAGIAKFRPTNQQQRYQVPKLIARVRRTYPPTSR